jgi:hypothetical protein
MDLENYYKLDRLRRYAYVVVFAGIMISILNKSCEDDVVNSFDLITVVNFDDGVEIVDVIHKNYTEDYLELCRTIESKEYYKWTDAKQVDMTNKKSRLMMDLSFNLTSSLDLNVDILRDDEERLNDYVMNQFYKIEAECNRISVSGAR